MRTLYTLIVGGFLRAGVCVLCVRGPRRPTNERQTTVKMIELFVKKKALNSGCGVFLVLARIVAEC